MQSSSSVREIVLNQDPELDRMLEERRNMVIDVEGAGGLSCYNYRNH